LPSYVYAQSTVDVHGSESGADLMKQMLSLDQPPDGVFAYNDPMAIGAIEAILDAGLRVPEDVAVIGAGNLYYDEKLRIPLSSIDQRTEEIGERTARLTLSLLGSKTRRSSKAVIIQPQLVIRASTNRKLAKRRASRGQG
jgi:LacI family transcriptional regulator